MEGLRDIRGLDVIGIWPLALGWWMLLAIATGVLVFLSVRWYRYRKFMRSWQGQSYKTLQYLEQQAAAEQPKYLLQQLAIEMRQIAMQKTDRGTCAGLSGQQWLQWLQENDPYSFAWSQHGTILINAQYMPDSAEIAVDQLRNLIGAAKMWVNKC